MGDTGIVLVAVGKNEETPGGTGEYWERGGGELGTLGAYWCEWEGKRKHWEAPEGTEAYWEGAEGELGTLGGSGSVLVWMGGKLEALGGKWRALGGTGALKEDWGAWGALGALVGV